MRLGQVRGSPFEVPAKNRANEYLGSNVNLWLMGTLKRLEDFQRSTEAGQSMKIKEADVKGLIKVMNHIKDMYTQEADLIRLQDEVFETLAHLEREGLPIDKQLKNLKKVSTLLVQLKAECHVTEQAIQPLVLQQGEICKGRIAEFEQELRTYQIGLKKEAYFFYKSGVELAFQRIKNVTENLDKKSNELQDLLLIAKNFEYPSECDNSFKVMAQMFEDVAGVRVVWEHEVERIKMTEHFLVQRWADVRPVEMEDDVKVHFKKLKEFKLDKKLDVYQGMQEVIKRWVVFCPLVGELSDTSMRSRHWAMLMKLCGKNVEVTSNILLRDMWNLELSKFPNEVEDIGEQARQESKMEAMIEKLSRIWSNVEYVFEAHKGTNIMLMRLKDEDIETLEENQVHVQNMFASRFLNAFETEVIGWQKTLANVSETTTLLSEVLRTWDFLENLFIHSEEVKKELPEESERFMDIDDEVKLVLAKGLEARYAKVFCSEPGIYQALEKTQAQLTLCQK
ncbi:unnamed protein product, partial [Polarella glacialis]